MQINKTLRRHLYDQVKKLDLTIFISSVSGISLSKSGVSHKGICPMPSHKDTEPSFFVTQIPDGTWLYDCFGCGSGGTIIDFCQDYFSLDHPSDALVAILEKSGMDTGQDALVQAIKQAKIGCDRDKKLECSHYVAARNCWRLLRAFPNDQKIENWVGKSYRRMNKMLADHNIRGIEIVGNEAINIVVSQSRMEAGTDGDKH